MQNNVYYWTPNKKNCLVFFQYNAFVFGLGCKFGQVWKKNCMFCCVQVFGDGVEFACATQATKHKCAKTLMLF
jgi:hypothetical protein